MKIVHYQDVEAKEVEEGSKLKMKLLNAGGSETFAVRHCEFEPRGSSPLHSHPWEHEMFIPEGQGSVVGLCFRPPHHQRDNGFRGFL